VVRRSGTKLKIMKIAVIIVRVLMGAMFLMASVMFFMKMTPENPPPMSDAAKTFNEGLMAAAYMMPLIKTVELVCGLLFVIGRYVALATVLIFPILLNILLFHAYLAPDGVLTPVLLMAGNLSLFYAYRKHYTGVFAPRRIE
jgi:putative oxidoreductase